jgi:hypothetical protein
MASAMARARVVRIGVSQNSTSSVPRPWSSPSTAWTGGIRVPADARGADDHLAEDHPGDLRGAAATRAAADLRRGAGGGRGRVPRLPDQREVPPLLREQDAIGWKQAAAAGAAPAGRGSQEGGLTPVPSVLRPVSATARHFYFNDMTGPPPRSGIGGSGRHLSGIAHDFFLLPTTSVICATTGRDGGLG